MEQNGTCSDRSWDSPIVIKAIPKDWNVFDYPSMDEFPEVGQDKTAYIDIEANSIYRWDPTYKEYVAIGGGGGGGTTDYERLRHLPTVNGVTLIGNKTTEDLGIAEEISTAVSAEAQTRLEADENLQEQIDAITSASDVVDVVGTYAELEDYDTSKLNDNDIIKVLQDETRNNAITYYRWVEDDEAFTYIGSQGPFYTKSESDSLLNGKVDKVEGKGLSTEDFTTEEKEKLAGLEGPHPYASLERNSEYLYTVTFDTLPEEQAPDNAVFDAACTSFVRDGKLYRNLDWYYNDNASFRVITRDFEGMSFANGLEDGHLDDEKIGQLPYHIVDGVNRHGIMVSTHVLYNDWEATGTGTVPLTKLPFIALTQIKSMATINADLDGVLSDMYVPEAMIAAGYLIQVLVTDGTTTYVLRPGNEPDQSYEAVNITNTPKLTNFRWVDRETVVRDGGYMQDHPTGVERWNAIDDDTTLEDLRFTKAYETPTYLSEFIGIDGTDKNSTDEELTEIYDKAHTEYLIRTRDGKLWQTMHSVVYSGKGMERLYVQENWNIDYAYATREYVDEAIAAVEGEIPELLTTTGQSEVAGMTQKAITDALANAGGIKVLSEADYNYPANSPVRVAVWLLDTGIYTTGNLSNDSIWLKNQSDTSDVPKNANGTSIIIVNKKSDSDRYILTISKRWDDTDTYAGFEYTINLGGNTGPVSKILTEHSIVDVLNSTKTDKALSANQGKVLKEMIDNLPTGGGVKTLTTDDYNWPTSNPDRVALWLLDSGVYTFHDSSMNVIAKYVGGTIYMDVDTYAIVGGRYDRGGQTVNDTVLLGGTNTGIWRIRADGGEINHQRILVNNDIYNYLVSDSTDLALSAAQGKVLKDLIDSLIIKGSGVPTTSTVGTVGKLYEDTANGDLYQCTAVSGSTYTWEAVGGGVQYSDLFADGSTQRKVQIGSGSQSLDVGFSVAVGHDAKVQANGGGGLAIGNSSSNSCSGGIALGGSATTYGPTSDGIYNGQIAIGAVATTKYGGQISIGQGATIGAGEYSGAIALGSNSGSNITAAGMMDVGTSSTSRGYNNTNYRLITGVHDGVNAHDVATFGQIQALQNTIDALEARIAALEGNS